MKLISIIIATYNASKTLKRCLDSIVPQLTDEAELIVVDGASTDDTNKIIDSYGNKISVHLSEPDKGIYDAWNKGIKAANGEWVMFVGADDSLHADAISVYLKKIQEVPNDCLLISCKRNMYSTDGKLIHTVGRAWTWPTCLKGMPISHPGALHRKTLFNEVGLFNIKYRISGDYDLLMRKAKSLNAEFINIVNIDVYEGGISDSYEAIREYHKVLESSPLVNSFKSDLLYVTMLAKYTVKKYFRKIGINLHS